MPYVMNPHKLWVKDPDHNRYLPQNVIATQTAEEQVALVQAAGAPTIAAVQQAVADAQAAVASIDAQRDTMIAAIASVAGQGTDDTFSQSGVAADAAAVGGLKSAISKNTENLFSFNNTKERDVNNAHVTFPNSSTINIKTSSGMLSETSFSGMNLTGVLKSGKTYIVYVDTNYYNSGNDSYHLYYVSQSGTRTAVTNRGAFTPANDSYLSVVFSAGTEIDASYSFYCTERTEYEMHFVPQVSAADYIARRALNEHADKIKNLIGTSAFDIQVQEWVIGNISNTIGTIENATNRIRTSVYIKYKAGDVIYFDNIIDYKYTVLFYTGDAAEYYVGTFHAITDHENSEAIYKENGYIKIVAAYMDNRTINQSDIADIISHIHYYRSMPNCRHIVDLCEPGSFFTTVGAKANSANFLRHRTRYVYEFTVNPEIIGVKTNALDSIDSLVLYLFDVNSSLLEMKEVSLRNNTAFIFNRSEVKYITVLIRHSEDTKNFRGIELFSDCDLQKRYNFNKGEVETYRSMPFNYIVSGDVMTSGRLLLPPNYDIVGDPVPLVVYVHGSGAIRNWTEPMYPEYMPYFKYICNEGFAVFDCYPWTDKEELDDIVLSPFNTVNQQRAYIEGIKYVCDRWNISIDNVVLYCKSLGGNLGHWFIIEDEFPLKAVGLFAPSTDPVMQHTDSLFVATKERRALTKYVDFHGTEEDISAFILSGQKNNPAVVTFLNKNVDKLVSLMPFAHGLNGSTDEDIFNGGFGTIRDVPEWMLEKGLPERETEWDYIPAIAAHSEYSKNARRPVKFWCAFDDTQTSSYGNYAVHQWLLNGGSKSEFRVLPLGTGGHHAMDTDENALKSSGTTRLGIQYTDIPTAYVELVEFFNRALNR